MMRIRHFLYTMMMCICSAVLSSCEHRILTDPTDIHYMRVYMDEVIKNVTCGFYNEAYDHPEYKRPLTMIAYLADAQTGKVISDGILRNQGNDERGYYIDGYIGAPAGDYHLVVYQMGSPVTLVKHTDEYFNMQAYTSVVSDRILGYLAQTSKVLGSDKIVQEPEHMMASRCYDVHINHSERVDTLKTADGDYFTAYSVAKSYYIQLKITGVQWIKAASAVLSGMAGSNHLYKEDGMNVEDPVNLYFSMLYDGKTQRSSNGDVLHATFTTFGKIPDMESELTLNFEFTKSDGSSQIETIDMTEVFKTPLAIENQWLLLDKEITITKPIGSGGMDPGVDGWREEEADLPM